MKQPIKAKGIRKYTGLMFRTRKTAPLIFEFNHQVHYPIHSYFVFFPFIAKWTFQNGEIERRIVFPFDNNIKPSHSFIKLEEIPL